MYFFNYANAYNKIEEILTTGHSPEEMKKLKWPAATVLSMRIFLEGAQTRKSTSNLECFQCSTDLAA